MQREPWRNELREYANLLSTIASGDRAKATKLLGDYLVGAADQNNTRGRRHLGNNDYGEDEYGYGDGYDEYDEEYPEGYDEDGEGYEDEYGEGYGDEGYDEEYAHGHSGEYGEGYGEEYGDGYGEGDYDDGEWVDEDGEYYPEDEYDEDYDESQEPQKNQPGASHRGPSQQSEPPRRKPVQQQTQPPSPKRPRSSLRRRGTVGPSHRRGAPGPRGRVPGTPIARRKRVRWADGEGNPGEDEEEEGEEDEEDENGNPVSKEAEEDDNYGVDVYEGEPVMSGGIGDEENEPEDDEDEEEEEGEDPDHITSWREPEDLEHDPDEHEPEYDPHEDDPEDHEYQQHQEPYEEEEEYPDEHIEHPYEDYHAEDDGQHEHDDDEEGEEHDPNNLGLSNKEAERHETQEYDEDHQNEHEEELDHGYNHYHNEDSPDNEEQEEDEEAPDEEEHVPQIYEPAPSPMPQIQRKAPPSPAQSFADPNSNEEYPSQLHPQTDAADGPAWNQGGHQDPMLQADPSFNEHQQQWHPTGTSREAIDDPSQDEYQPRDEPKRTPSGSKGFSATLNGPFVDSYDYENGWGDEGDEEDEEHMDENNTHGGGRAQHRHSANDQQNTPDPGEEGEEDYPEDYYDYDGEWGDEDYWDPEWDEPGTDPEASAANNEEKKKGFTARPFLMKMRNMVKGYEDMPFLDRPYEDIDLGGTPNDDEEQPEEEQQDDPFNLDPSQAQFAAESFSEPPRKRDHTFDTILQRMHQS